MLDQGRFTRSGMTDNADKLARLHTEREVVHYQRFAECLQRVQDRADKKNIYGYNPAFDKRRR